METIDIKGGCFCGEVRYRATCKPHHSGVCYCSNCQRVCAAQSVGWVAFSADSFSFEQGEPVRYRSRSTTEWSFCGHCGTTLTYHHDDRPNEIDVTIGSLDDPEAFPPTEQTWVEEKLSWA